MKTKIKKIDIGALSPLLLFTVFSVCVLLVLIMGADIYESFTEHDRISYDHRTVSQYLITRVHQSDADGAYRVGGFNDTESKAQGDTFFFCEEYDGIKYETRIYCHEGYLYELFAEAGAGFEPVDGIQILPLQSAGFSIDGGLLTIDVIYADGTADTIIVELRSSMGGSL